MVNMDIVKYFCETVVIGLPESPFPFLYQLRQRRGRRVHVFLARRYLPFYLSPLAIPHPLPADGCADISLLRLLDFAESCGDKVLTLIPSTPEAEAFVAAHREALETAYIIQNKDFQ